MLSYDEAVARILSGIAPLPCETLPLIDCLGRVLARHAAAPINLPPFDNSSMDGFAVRSVDTSAASSASPIRLRVTDEIPAGYSPMRNVEPGSAARIFTGSVLPPGADAIVPIEDTLPNRDRTQIDVVEAASAGAYIRRTGSDIEAGQVALTNGEIVTPAAAAFAASLGLSSLPVITPPKVAIIATGSELVQPGEPLQLGQIYNSNTIALQALCLTAGAMVPLVKTAVDNVNSVREALNSTAGSGADVILTAGGVSVGDYDLVKQVVEEEGGGSIDFWRVAIRPGKPFVFGSFKGCLFFGLPGNPVSAMVTFELFVRPALRRLGGHPVDQCVRQTVHAVLTSPASHEPGRRSFQRAWTDYRDGRLVTAPVAGQSSHQISGMVRANSLLIVPEDQKELRAGTVGSVMFLA